MISPGFILNKDVIGPHPRNAVNGTKYLLSGFEFKNFIVSAYKASKLRFKKTRVRISKDTSGCNPESFDTIAPNISAP